MIFWILFADKIRSLRPTLFALSGLACLALLVVTGSLGGTLRADTLTGEVRGAVLDVDGNLPLTDVSLTLQNVDRGWERTTTTDAFGSFAFLQLEPGNYTVQATIDAYYSQEKTGVLVRLNQPKIVLPPFMLRKEVATATAIQQITLRGEQTRTAVVDLTSTGPDPVVLAYLSEPGITSMLTLLDWAIRANYDSQLLLSLPLRGVRSFDQLGLLSPGVFRVPFSSGQGPAVGIGVGTTGQFAVNGMRGRSNNFTVDGSDNNDEDIGVRRQGFVALVPQSSESVQEFQIITAGFAAEFGRNAGSMVNVVSRSGGNEMHGDVYGLFANDALSSNGFFDQSFSDSTNSGESLNGGSIDGRDFSQQLLGAVVGGPLIRDRLFFFGSLEYQRRTGSALGHFVVPGEAERGLNTRDGFIPIEELGAFFADRPGFRHSALAGEGIYSLYPRPNNPAGPFQSNTYSQVQPDEGEGLVLSIKKDWYLSDSNSFSGRYNFTDDDSILPFTSDSLNSMLATRTRTQNLSLFLNTSSSGWANGLRFSYGRTALRFPPEKSSPFLFGSDVPRTAQGEIPDQLANVESLRQTIQTPFGDFGPFGTTGPIGQLLISPYSGIGIDVYNFPQSRVDNTYQLADAFTVTTGRHTLKFGADIRWSQLNSSLSRNSRPLQVFGNGLLGDCRFNPTCLFNLGSEIVPATDFAALGTPASFFQTLTTRPLTGNTIGLRFTQFDFFFQDDVKLARNLSLNLGLRYERQTVPEEQNRKIEDTFQQALGDQPMLLPEEFSSQPPPGSFVSDRNIVAAGNFAFGRALAAYGNFVGNRDKIYLQDRNNLGPRIGLAWDLTGRGEWVVRAGYSISYDANLGAVTSQSRGVFPTFIPINLDPSFLLTSGGGNAGAPGLLVPNPIFFGFRPTGESLIRPGSLDQFGAAGQGPATAIGSLLQQALAGSLRVNGLAFTLPSNELDSPYAQHYLFSLQHQLGRNHAFTAEYVGTHGVNLTRFSTPNSGMTATPVLLSSFSNPLTVGAFSPARPVTDLGAFTIFSNSAQSNYHSLQLSFLRRQARGLQFQTQYTWSHTIDQVSDPFDGRGFFAFPQDTDQFFLERGPANFDNRHRMTFLAAWKLPWEGNALAREWSISAIGEFSSGQPYTVNTSLDRNQDGNLTDRLDTIEGLSIQADSPIGVSLMSGTSTEDLVAGRRESGRVGRNTFLSDGFANIDFALSRRFPLAGDSSLLFRLEAFNLLNQTSFGIPIRILESAGFGRSYDTQSPARSFRLSLKLSF